MVVEDHNQGGGGVEFCVGGWGFLGFCFLGSVCVLLRFEGVKVIHVIPKPSITK